jgi:hypothetical protein
MCSKFLRGCAKLFEGAGGCDQGCCPHGAAHFGASDEGPELAPEATVIVSTSGTLLLSATTSAVFSLEAAGLAALASLVAVVASAVEDSFDAFRGVPALGTEEFCLANLLLEALGFVDPGCFAE